MKKMNGFAQSWHDKAMAAPLDDRSRELRRDVIKILECSRRGHLGSSLSLIEVLRVLYDDILRFDPARPDWPERDRCILSKGHGCIPLYVFLAEKGFFPKSELASFCQYEGLLGGHPDATKIPGVEASTGSLGHGLSIGVGMALSARLDKRDSKVFVIVGDGECNEGSVWEACMSAGVNALDNLCLLVDYNKYQSYDATCCVQDLEPLADKFESFRMATRHVNGHNVAELQETLRQVPFEKGRPSAIICHTVKGKGISFAENNLEWHHKSSISDEMMKSISCALDEAP
ncbi:transketolase [Desulfovibrio inopinatus]|uniref:transketolase n=1 Tax=Desulfovibrio inopinatus TaxID=102109 RepID=UPI00041A98FF|nr:transketolase [Desulfovibrio inopinatus]